MRKFYKAIFIASAALCLNFSAYAQSISLNMKKVTVKQAIEQLKKESGYSFVFASSILDTERKVSVSLNKASIDEAVRQILNGQDGLDYEIQDKTVIVRKSAAHSNKVKKVSGRIVDASGEPLIGAAILEKGTTNGVTTDFDGKFEINLTTENPQLICSYVGYKQQIVRALSGKSLNIALAEDAELLEEVVVVGYGTQSKVNLTGSVASVSGKELTDRPVTSIQAAIQGVVPGLTITNSQGRPGEDSSTLRVRGTGTLNNSNPYILIDGVEGGSMSQLDPNDIESISVLKDAASAAIYGSKAANGVILITTKRGQSGRPVLTYNGSLSWQNPTGHIERMSSVDAASYYNYALEQSGKSPRFTEEDIRLFRDGTDPYEHPNTDWYDLAFQGSGFMHQHNANVTGGSDNVKYMASVGYLNQQGIIQHSNREQFNLRANLDLSLSKKIAVHANLSYIHNDYNDPTNSYVGGGSDQIIRQVNRIAPWIVYKAEDGSYGTIGDGNPIAWLDLNQVLNRKKQNFQGILSVDYQILDGLKFTAKGAYVSNVQMSTDFVKDIQYNAGKYHGPNHIAKTNYSWNRPSLDLLLNYEKSFGRHNVKGLLGYKVEKYNYEELYAYREDFPNNDLTDINAGNASTQKGQGYTRELALMSYFARVNYDYAGRYLFEANFRADASSRFSPDNRWGYFPSLSAGWRVSEEAFMESTKDWLQNLKIRGSWGQLGNQDALTDYYPWLATYSIGKNYPFGGNLASGITQTSQKLETISWEKSTTWGIGFDMSFLSCLDFTFDYYNRKTTGIIMDVQVPGSFGLGAYKDNVGSMRNRGVEMSLGYHTQWSDWTFRANGNIALNRNEILDLGGVNEMINSYYIDRIGKPYHAFYGYVADGLFHSQEEADAYTEKYGNPFGKAKAFKAGDVRYVDVNGDGKLTSADRDVISSEQPKFTFGLNLSATYKNFDASVLLQGACGVSRYFNSEVFGEFIGDESHPATAWFDAWSEANPNGKFPRIIETEYTASYPNTVSSFWIFNTNYLRFKNIQLGYTLPSNWLKRLGVSRARIYYSGENLFTIDNLPVDIDPESPSGRGSHYPQVSTNSFGINLTF